MRWIWVLVLMVTAGFFPSAPPALAAPCTLYQGGDSAEQLKRQEQFFLKQGRDHPQDPQPFCQLAHIHFKRAGQAAESSQRIEEYRQCIENADRAIARDPEAAAAYFFKALCLGKRGEIQGLWSSLTIIGPFEQLMSRAAALDPGLNSGGPHRALGRYYYKLPWFLGGDLDKSIRHLEEAVRLAPHHWENLLFLAEAYHENGQNAQARQTLLRLIETTRTRPQSENLAAPLKRARALLNEIEAPTSHP